MVRKENQRIALTRRLLQEGLLRLLSTESLDEISVTALCKEAGINRATFYNHYTSPAALLAEMEDQFVAELNSLYKAHPTIEDVLFGLEQYCIKLKENKDLLNILTRYHSDSDIEKVFEQVASYYEHNRLDTANMELEAESIRLISTFLHAGCYVMIREWSLRDIQKTPREIAELVLKIINTDYL